MDKRYLTLLYHPTLGGKTHPPGKRKAPPRATAPLAPTCRTRLPAESASTLHRKVRSCILAIAEKQNTKRVDALGRNNYQSFVQIICVCWGRARRMSWHLRSLSRMRTRIRRFSKN